MKLEQAPHVQNGSRFNQARLRTDHGLVGPIAGDRQTAFFLVVKTKDFPSGHLPDFEDGQSLSFERMKRMGDQRQSPKRDWKRVHFAGSVPTVRDRIVQGAVLQVIEPIFEREFATQSYGFRPGKGCKDALRRVDELLKSGKYWVLDADLKSYFDTIPHERLMERVGEKVSDGRVLNASVRQKQV